MLAYGFVKLADKAAAAIGFVAGLVNGLMSGFAWKAAVGLKKLAIALGFSAGFRAGLASGLAIGFAMGLKSGLPKGKAETGEYLGGLVPSSPG
jgi:hypothetical protein